MSIENHKFQDIDIKSVDVTYDVVVIYLKDCDGIDFIQLDRDDIIELAKAIELTGEDLK